jgi:hypothetical protein
MTAIPPETDDERDDLLHQMARERGVVNARVPKTPAKLRYENGEILEVDRNDPRTLGPNDH